MLSEPINVDRWHRLREVPKGSREKQWVLKPLKSPQAQAELFLFKESSKRYPAEFWAEIIAAEVGKIIGVPTPEIHCAYRDDKYAALVKFFLKMQWQKDEHRSIQNLLDGMAKIKITNPKYRLSPARRELMLRIVCLRRGMLKEVFEL